MQKEILIVKNITREGPGLLAEVLVERDIPYTLVDLDSGESFLSTKDFGAVVVLGGPDSANDSTDKMEIELERISETVASGSPYLGICLGLQTLVKAHGGNVVQNPVREIGFRDQAGELFSVELTDVGKTDPLFAGMGTSFDVFHLHGETVTLTEDMTLLATGKHCKNQIVKIGENAYGIQCHFELTSEMFEAWISEDPELLELNTEELRADFESKQVEYTTVGKALLNNFLDIAGYDNV